MIVSGWILFVIGLLSFVGQAIGSAGLTIYSFILPVTGAYLVFAGYKRQKKD